MRITLTSWRKVYQQESTIDSLIWPCVHKLYAFKNLRYKLWGWIQTKDDFWTFQPTNISSFDLIFTRLSVPNSDNFQQRNLIRAAVIQFSIQLDILTILFSHQPPELPFRTIFTRGHLLLQRIVFCCWTRALSAFQLLRALTRFTCLLSYPDWSSPSVEDNGFHNYI